MFTRVSSIVVSMLLAAAAVGSAQPPFVRTVIVNSGGTPTANGTALLNAITNITTNSSNNTWLVKVEPGVFDLGSGTLTMKDYVDVEGSGRDVTFITSTQPWNGSSNLGTITVPSSVHAELRDLTVQNTNPTTQAVGVNTGSSNFSARAVNVLFPAAVSNSFAFFILSSSPTLTQIGIQMSSCGTSSQGIYSAWSSPTIKDLTITNQNTCGLNEATGVLLIGGSAVIDGVTATVSGAQSDYGIRISNAATPLITNARLNVTGVSAAWGIRSYTGNCTFENLKITVSGGGSNYGIVFAGGPSTNSSVVRRAAISVSGALSNDGVYLVDNASATLRDLDVRISGAAGSQTAGVIGDYFNGGTSGNTVSIIDSTVQASGGTTNVGIDATGTGNTFTIVRTTATASTGTSYGLAESNTGNTFTLDHSQLSGGTDSVHLNSTFGAGASQLAGPVFPLTGTCAACYNGSYNALSATCQ